MFYKRGLLPYIIHDKLMDVILSASPIAAWHMFIIHIKNTEKGRVPKHICPTPKANTAKLTRDHISKCLGIDTDQSIHTLQLPPQLEGPIEMSNLY
jgi:hypothetical protein